MNIPKLERGILVVSTAFVLSLFALVFIANATLGIGLPTCITDIKPFNHGDVLFHAPDHYEIHYVARMWKFEPENVEVPIDSTVDIYLSSLDVTHGFDILGTNVNLLAVPGVVNYASYKFTKAGEYEILCHEYCGSGHHDMATRIHVYDPAVQTPAALTPATAEPTHPGYKVMQLRSCTACHTIDGRPGTGPTFKGLWGRNETLADGRTIQVDAAHIRESIRQPNATIVKGFQPIMPTLPVTDPEIDQIIDFLKTLK